MFGQQRVAIIDNWRVTTLSGGRDKARTVKPNGTGKGHGIEMERFIQAVRTGSESPISLASAVATTKTAFKIQESMSAGGARIRIG